MALGLFMYDHVDNAGQHDMCERWLTRISLEVQGKLDGAPGELGFPDCIAKEEDMNRAKAFFEFVPATDLRKTPGDAVLCRSKLTFKDGKVVLLRNGRILHVKQ